MDFSEETSFILFLPGVFPRDVIDDEPNSSCIRDIDLNNFKSESINDIEYSDDSDSDTALSEVPESEEIPIEDIYSFAPKPAIEKHVEEYDEIPKYYINKASWLKYWTKPNNDGDNNAVKTRNLSAQICNILCASCGNLPRETPWPIPYNRTKILQTVHDENQNLFIYLKDKDNKSTELNDENLLISCQDYKEVKVFQIRDKICCTALCVVWYLNHVKDSVISNTDEAKKMLYVIYNESNGTDLSHVPESDDPYQQNCFKGRTGITPMEYMARNQIKESRIRIINNKQ